jgi:hypothetical protein
MKRTLPLIPTLAFVFWLTAVGFLVWRKAHMSLFPPEPDAFSYIQKAVHFWDNAKKGFPVNPLNLMQTLRPPGTVLISFPFGYDGDFKAFHFRTVFIPFLVWTSAILLLFWPTRESPDWKSGATKAILAAILFGACPVLFHFESKPIGLGTWGLMDQALGAAAGFAMAATYRSQRTRSTSLLCIGIAMACFSLLLKPAGALAIVYCGLYFLSAEYLRIRQRRRNRMDLDPGYAAKGVTMFVVMGGGMAWICASSKYLDKEQVALFTHAQSILTSLYSDMDILTGFQRLYRYLGPQGACLFAITLLTAFKKPRRLGYQNDGFPLVFFIFIFTSGLYLWIFRFGSSNLRYFSPFAFMGLSILAGWLANQSEGFAFHRYSKPLAVLCLLSSLNLLALLAIREPNPQWQRFSGVSVDIADDTGNSGVIFNHIMDRYAGSRKEPVVFKVSLDVPCLFLDLMNSDYHRMADSNYRGVRVLGSINWFGNPALSLYEMVFTSDLLLIPKDPVTIDALKPESGFNVLYERRRILSFINASLDREWMRVEKTFGDLSLVRILDRDRFMASIDSALAGEEGWTPPFREVNGYSQGRLHLFQPGTEKPPLPESKEVVKSMMGSIHLIEGREPMGDTVYTTRALSLNGWLYARVKKRIAPDSFYLTVDRAGHPTLFYSALKNGGMDKELFSARIDLKGMDTCRLGLAMVKDGILHRYGGYRKTVIVDPNVLDGPSKGTPGRPVPERTPGLGRKDNP